MKPGIYNDIPNQEYHTGIRALSASGLKLLGKSPAHYREAIDNPKPPTPAMLFGSAFHSYLLEPESFKNEFVVDPGINRRTKAGKAEYEAFNAEHSGKSVISQDDMAVLIAMRESAMRSNTVLGFFSDMKVETSIVWDDPLGFQCKARPDILSESISAVVDLKTAVSADDYDFARAIINFGYHFQALHYMTGIRETIGDVYNGFYFIVIEKSPPYCVKTVRMSEDFIEIAKPEYNRLRGVYAECIEKKEWPGYADRVVDIFPPAWAMK